MVALKTNNGRTNEMGFTLCRTQAGRLVAGPVATGTPTSVDITVACPKGARYEGLFHTHPGGVASPSTTDVRSALRTGAKNMCIDADGDLRCWRVVKRR